MNRFRKMTALVVGGVASTAGVAAPAMAATVDYNLNGPAGIVHTEKSAGDVTVETIGVDFDGLGDLLGWNTKADGSGTTYNVGDKVSADATLYAQYSDHTMLASGLTETDGKTYYYVDGSKKTGIVNVGGQLMYFDPSDDGALAHAQWLEVSGKTYYADGDGVLKANQVTEIDGKRYVFAADGTLSVGFVTVSGKTYCADGAASSGVHAGWVAIDAWVAKDGKKAYATSDGSLATGIVSINGMSHMFASDGIAVSAGWHETGLSDKAKAWCETTGDTGLIVTWSTQNDSLMTTFAGWDIDDDTRTQLLNMGKDRRDSFEVLVRKASEQGTFSAFTVDSANDDDAMFELAASDGPWRFSAEYRDGEWAVTGLVIPAVTNMYPTDVYTTMYAGCPIKSADKESLGVLSDEKSESLETAVKTVIPAVSDGVYSTTMEVVSVNVVGAEVKPSVGDIVRFTVSTGWRHSTGKPTLVTAYVATYGIDGWSIAKDVAEDDSDTDKKDDSDTDKKDDSDTDFTTFAGMTVIGSTIDGNRVHEVLSDTYADAETAFSAWLREQGVTASDYQVRFANVAYSGFIVTHASVELALVPVSGADKQILVEMSYDDGAWSVALNGAEDVDDPDASDTSDEKDGAASKDSSDSGNDEKNANTADEVAENTASSSNNVSADATQAVPKDKATLQTGIESAALPVAVAAVVCALASVMAFVRRRRAE